MGFFLDWKNLNSIDDEVGFLSIEYFSSIWIKKEKQIFHTWKQLLPVTDIFFFNLRIKKIGPKIVYVLETIFFLNLQKKIHNNNEPSPTFSVE